MAHDSVDNTRQERSLEPHAMEYLHATTQTLLRLADLAQQGNPVGIDVPPDDVNPEYARSAIALALASPDAEMKAMGALLRQELFGPAGVFARRIATERVLDRMKTTQSSFQESSARASTGKYIGATAPT